MKTKKEFNIKTDPHQLFFREQGKARLIRSDNEGEPTKFVGRAIVFNKESLPVGMAVDGDRIKEVREIIAPEALDEVLSGEYDIRALSSHDSSAPSVIGRTKAGTLTLEKDAEGVVSTILIPNTSVGRDLEVLIDRGDIDGMSFGFYADYDTIERVDKGDYILQIIHRITEVLEVSIVAWPAYKATSVNVRDVRLATPIESESKKKLLSLEKRRLEIAKQKIKLWKI